MNTTSMRLSALGLLASLALGCNKEPEPVQVESPELAKAKTRLSAKLDEAKASLEQQKAELVGATQKRLDLLDAKIAELKQKAEASGKEASQEAVGELEEKRAEVEAALNKAKSATSEQWDEMTASARQALDEAEATYNRTLEALKTK